MPTMLERPAAEKCFNLRIRKAKVVRDLPWKTTNEILDKPGTLLIAER